MGMPPGRGAGEGVAGGEANKIFGEEGRGRVGVREREEARRGWSWARPSEKASLAGRVMIATAQHRNPSTSAPRGCAQWTRQQARSDDHFQQAHTAVAVKNKCIMSTLQ